MVIGGVVGADIDKKMEREVGEYPGWREPAKKSVVLRVDLRDGSAYEGRFSGYNDQGQILLRPREKVAADVVAIQPELIAKTTVPEQPKRKWVWAIVGGMVDVVAFFILSNVEFNLRLGGR